MNQPSLLEYAYSLTVDDLIRLMPEIEAKLPKTEMPPNPSDVHPATFAALVNACDGTRPAPLFDTMAGIVLHVRTDVEPWKMHPCTCKRNQ